MVDPAPSSVSAYLDPHYWDKRFSAEEHYEWLKDYSHFKHLLHRHIHSTHHVLELGCGNSQLSENILTDKIASHLTCTDISSIAVQKMKTRLSKKGIKDIQVMEADMLQLPFSNNSFDVVIEKGTMDTLFVDSGDPWNPKAETVVKVKKMLEEVYRVLKPDGVFISVSFGQPHFRRPLFERSEFDWKVEVEAFGDGFHYFFYSLKKGMKSEESERCCSHGVSELNMKLYHDELEGAFMSRLRDRFDATSISGDKRKDLQNLLLLNWSCYCYSVVPCYE